MNKTAPKKEVAKLGTIMGVWAHPDDETFMAGGLAATAAANGQTVICVTATRGELGVQDSSKWPSEKLSEIRSKEIARALCVLSVKHHYFLDYADGACCQVRRHEAVSKLMDLIKTHRPDTLITLPPDGGTGHLDHICVSSWTLEASKQADLPLYYAVELEDQHQKHNQLLGSRFNIYFNIDKPVPATRDECDILLELTPAITEIKCRALEAMPSQTERLFEAVGFQRMGDLMSIEGYIRADKKRQWGKVKTVNSSSKQ